MTRRVVLDTNIIVSGFGWGGVPRLVLDATFDGRFVAATSVALHREVEEVIRRSRMETAETLPILVKSRQSRTEG